MAVASLFRTVWSALLAAISRLETSVDPKSSLANLRAAKLGWRDISTYSTLFVLAVAALYIMEFPPFPFKLAIPLLYVLALLLPVTAQFFEPATPILSYLLTFYSSRFIPNEYRPTIHVALLPTLETVLYGANVSDILTRFTHPILDIISWLPYGVIHFTAPFVVALLLWLFKQKPALRFWATAFGYMNLVGVLCQDLFPCAAPWYELIYGLTPADYSIRGHPGGLARIDAIFHSQGYTKAFGVSPVVFGAFPSLHAGCATIEVLFLSHFFPRFRLFYWLYAMVLYWATMYLTHHYLIDVVGGACLAVAAFYFFLPDELRDPDDGTNKYNYERYDIEEAARRRTGTWTQHESEGESDEFPLSSPPEDPHTPNSSMPFFPRRSRPSGTHRQTASIASLSGPGDGNQADWAVGLGRGANNSSPI